MAPDRRLGTRRWGDGDPRVVCWPGLTISAHAHFEEAGPRWAEAAGGAVVAVEPPGWLDEPLPDDDYTLDRLAGHALGLLDDLGLDAAAWVGWSWGASLGCHAAARAPERIRALVLLDAGFTDLQDDPAFEPRAIDELVALLDQQDFRFPDWEPYLEVMRSRTRGWRPELEERARAGMREQDGELVPVVARRTMAAAFHGVEAAPPSSTLAALGGADLPVLVVAASGTVAQDWAQTALERFREAVPRAEVETVDAGHDVIADAPDETIELVGRWLASRLD